MPLRLTIRTLLLAFALVTASCAAKVPPTVAPADALIWQADQALVVIGTVQHAAIGLHAISVCDPLPCHPLLSTVNTGIVVDAATDGIVVVYAAPAGWKAAGLAFLDRVAARLDAAGQTTLKSYLQAARAIFLGQ